MQSILMANSPFVNPLATYALMISALADVHAARHYHSCQKCT